MNYNGIGKGIVAAVCMGLAVMAAAPSAVMAKVPEQVQPMADYISDCSATLRISNTGSATVEVDIMPKGSVGTSIEAILQRRTASGWENVKTWNMKKDSGYTFLSETYSVSKGTYRVYAIVKAGSETKYPVSATKTY